MFLLLTSQKLNDDSRPVAISVEESLDVAYMKLHQGMASAYANENMVSCLMQVMNENGTICKTDYFSRETVEPTTVEATE